MRSRSDRPRSATASTRERSRRAGATTSSGSSTGPIRSCTRRPARTQLLRRRPLPRQLRRTGRRLRQHDRPHDDLRPTVATIPSDPAQARAEFPWIDFQGRWGELQPAFFNGPTGPNLKTQWAQPITLVGGLARPELHRPGRERVRDGGDRLLLPRDRQWLEGAGAARPSTVAVHPGPRAAGAAAPVRPLANRLAPDRAAPPRAPARLGPDARRGDAHVPRETGTDARDRDPVHPDRVPDRAPAIAPGARHRHPRCRDRQRPAAGCSASSCWRSGRR